MVVVVPAHNEEKLLARCLASVGAATHVLEAARPGVHVTTVVVLDRCRDRTQQVASMFAADVVSVEAGNVGVARAHGVRRASDLSAHVAPQRVWIASTDADSVVPECWLSQQIFAAESGARMVLGRVEPDPADVDEAVYLAWRHRHPRDSATDHVHGANLGIRLDLYREVGGFSALAEHEDVALVSSVLEAGVVPQPGTKVLTSGRLRGRVDGGFSGYLRRLRLELVRESPALLD